MVRAFFISALLLTPGIGMASDTHCEDDAARHDWETRTGNHPDDTALQTLHALWLGLCTKVQAGDLTTAAKCFKKVENATALIWKILRVAEATFRRLKGAELLPAVYTGVQYMDGVPRATSTQKIAA